MAQTKKTRECHITGIDKVVDNKKRVQRYGIKTLCFDRTGITIRYVMWKKPVSYIISNGRCLFKTSKYIRKLQNTTVQYKNGHCLERWIRLKLGSFDRSLLKEKYAEIF